MLAQEAAVYQIRVKIDIVDRPTCNFVTALNATSHLYIVGSARVVHLAWLCVCLCIICKGITHFASQLAERVQNIAALDHLHIAHDIDTC